MNDTKTLAIIPAGGCGQRFANAVPKQYYAIHGYPMLMWSIAPFLLTPEIDSVYIVLHSEDVNWQSYSFQHSKLFVHYCGGKTRSETVLNALDVIDPKENDWLLVHDAVRPGLTVSLLGNFLKTLSCDSVGGLLALPVIDSLKYASSRNVERTLDREHVWRAQTPQMFRAGLLKRALQKFPSVVDDAQAIELLGYQAKLIPGEPRNLKITYLSDLDLIMPLLQRELPLCLE